MLVAFPLGVMKIFQQQQLTDVFVLTHSTKDHPMVVGKPWEQEFKGAGYILSAVKKQRQTIHLGWLPPSSPT